MAKSQNGVNWVALGTGATVLIVMIAAFWSLAFGPIQIRFETTEKTAQERYSILDGRSSKLEAAFLHFQQLLDARRSEFPTQFEHKEFKERVLDRIELIQRQLLLLEQTRPSTGELQGVAKGNEVQVNKLEERIRSLEIFVRQPVKAP